MEAAAFVLVVGTLIAITVFVIAASPVRGPRVLGLGALAVGSACLVASALMPNSSPGMDAEDIPRMALGLVGLAHFLLALLLFGVSGFNRNRSDHR